MKKGFLEGMPIGIGYFPIAIAFGIMAKVAGISLWETIGFSSILFAGAAQFIGISMLVMGVSAPEIILATFFLNFRHFIMSATLANKVSFHQWYKRLVIGHFVTDETFSVASFTHEELSFPYMITMQITGFLGWNIGTIVGFIAGNVLPTILTNAMGIGLYAMFVALLIPECKKYQRGFIIAALSGILNSILVIGGLSQGWSIVMAILIVSYGHVLYSKRLLGVTDVD